MKYPYISRSLEGGIIYNGDVNNVDLMHDSDGAYKWYSHYFSSTTGDPVKDPTKTDDGEKTNKPLVKFRDEKLSVYGLDQKMRLPIIETEYNTQNILENCDIEDVTDHLYNYLIRLSKGKMLSDVVMGVRQKVFKDYRIYKIEEYKEISHIGLLPVFHNQDVVQETAEQKKPSRKIASSGDMAGVIIGMKEYLDGYVITYKYKLHKGTGRSKKAITSDDIIEIDMKADYEVTHPITNEPIILPDNYTAKMRYNFFYSAALARKQRLNLNFVPPLMFDWQYDVIKKMGKRTLFTHIRRAGKTILLSYLAMRALMRDNPNKALRPTAVLYVGLQERNLKPVISYIMGMVSKLGEYANKIFSFNAQDNMLIYKEGTNTLGYISFVSAHGRNPAVGDFCDTLIVDEAAKISEEVWSLIEPFVSNEGADLIAASTMYKGIKKNWFYNLLLEYERDTQEYHDIDQHILQRFDTTTPETHVSKLTPDELLDHYTNRNVGIRFTLDDDQRHTDREKEIMRNELLERDPEKYFCEYYSRFPDEGKVFNYSPFLQNLDETLHRNMANTMTGGQKRYDHVVVAYDPALSSDVAAVMVLGYDGSINKVVILEEYAVNKFEKSSYINHPPQIASIREQAKTRYLTGSDQETYFVMDGTHRSTADVFIIKKQYPHMRIFYAGGNNCVKSKVIQGEYATGKGVLVSASRDILSSKNMIIGNHLNNLKKELDNFYELDTGSGVTKYEGVKCHDDYVNAMMMGVFFLYEGLQLKYKIVTDTGIKVRSDNDILGEVKHPLADGLPRMELHEMVSKEDVKESNNEYFRNFIY